LQLTLEQITALYHFGKFQYTYGNYSGAADYLYHFRVLSTDTDLNTSAHWGKLASDILTGKWDVALEELNALREMLDARASAAPLVSAVPSHTEPLATLHSRAWFVHWSLFVYFNHPAGRTLLLETFLAPAYLNTIQSAAPWILRYLAVAAVLSRRAQASGAAGAAAPVSSRVRHAIREVVKVVQLEEYQYSDPVTKFLRELYVEFDFEAAQRQLQLAERVVGNDFFLGDYREDFLDNARYLITEAYCRIHQRIDIAYVALRSTLLRFITKTDTLASSDLSARLNLSPEEGEKWIVNLIRDTRMAADAKIDLEKARCFHHSKASLRTNDPAAECYRDSPPGVANLPVRHREDAWAEHPNPSSRCRTQSDRTTATGAAYPGATGSCRGCSIKLKACNLLVLL
jgi:translation initiation factor 3 subunit E